MSNLTRAMMMGAAGASGGKTYVDDVFSTYLMDGNAGTQTISNGIDLAGEGGMVWSKVRNQVNSHQIWDTERGATYTIIADSDRDQYSNTNLTSFTSTGFTLGDQANINLSNATGATWSFRKAPGFFDVVTWTGNGVDERLIPHSLESTPGMIMVKCTSDASTSWQVWHRSIPDFQYLMLNSNSALQSGSRPWGTNTQTINSTHFSVNNYSTTNSTSKSYVAYVFAHDSQSFGSGGDESIIKCGSYTGDGNADGPTINLGWEPQWLLVKNSTYVSFNEDWNLIDTMRGWDLSNASGSYRFLEANTTDAETGNAAVRLKSTGFQVSGSGSTNISGQTYIYMAIRRPNKPPTAATEVFDDVVYTGTAAAQNVSISPRYADLVFYKRLNTTDNWGWTSRLQGNLAWMNSASNSAVANRAAGDALEYDKQSAFGLVGNSSGEVNYSGASYVSYAFKRAPGFFDMVTYVGDGSFDGSYTVNHNLQASPEMIITKRYDSTDNWTTYHTGLTSDSWQIYLNQDYVEGNTGNVYWAPTATTFKPQYAGNADNSANQNGGNYIAYLFASLSGISKVGTYTGTTNDLNVDCGFTSGARFVLIKRTDAQGDWFVWDSARGINPGTDPYCLINTTAAQVTNTDAIDPLSSGFKITSATNVGLNTYNAKYIFLAIA